MSSRQTNGILFDLTEDTLIVANTGKQFSRKGVVSICNMDLSAKDPNSDYMPDDKVYDKDDAKLVSCILRKRLDKYNYSDGINDLTEHVRHEKSIRKSYAGRFVWELLQNADDAANAEEGNEQLIGTKGLGFKSVLEITDEPEIYSGKFCFHFSREKSREMLRDVERWTEKKGIPVCRLPHDKKPDPEVQELLDEGYATVIRLPLKSQAKEVVENKLSEFCGYSLLFCRHLESVEIRTKSASRHIAVRRLNEDGKIELTENGNCNTWRVWRQIKKVDGEKHISASVCLPFDGAKVSHCEEVPPLNVFFPTAEEISGVHAQIHASCEVEDNREHLRKEQPHRKEICEMLKNITREILSDIPADVALRAFGRVECAVNGETIAPLGGAIAKVVRETAFIPLIGGGKATPGGVRLWRHNLGNAVDPDKVRDKNLCDSEINNNEEIVCILGKWDAQQIPEAELSELLQFCRNATEDDCLTAWDVAQLLMEEAYEKEQCMPELRKAPFWRVRNGKVRAIDSDIPLLRAKPQGCPEWLPVDVVDKGFWKRIQEKIMQSEEEKTLYDEISPFGESKYFDKILLPYCEKQSPDGWRENGWKILEVAIRWGMKSDKNEPLIINSNNATESRAKIFHLPVGKDARQWVPAWKCYAGKAWDGLEIFDKHLATIPDRYILSPRNAWEINIDDGDGWKNLLTWLGCSWMPKMERLDTLHRKNSHYDEHTRYGCKPEWDFCFEIFDDIFPREQNYKPLNYEPLLNAIPEMHNIADKNKARYFFRVDQSCDSYALEQLHNNEWVLCRKSLLYPDKRWFAPKDVYLPGRGLGGLLPEIRKPDLDEPKWSQIKDVFKVLDANNSITNDAEKLSEYMNRLSECAGDKNAISNAAIEKAAKEIFSTYEKIESPSSLDDDVMVPCLRNTPKGERIYFERAGDVCWADQSYFADPKVRRIIMETEKLHVFFRFLRDGEKFGLAKLSEFLEMVPVYEGEPLEKETRELCTRYKERRIGLIKAADETLLYEKELPKQLELTAYKRITLMANSQVGINPEIKFWKQDECNVAVNARGQSTMWEGLAAALGEVWGCPDYKSDFELLLKEKTRDDFLRRLRDNYNLTRESIEEATVPLENNCEYVVAIDARQDSENNHGDPLNTASPDTTSTPPRGTATRTTGARSRPTSEIPNFGNSAIKDDQAFNQSSEIPEVEVVEHDFGAAGNAPSRHGGGHGVSHEEREVGGGLGERGEGALLMWLKSEFGDDNVTDMNKEIPNNPGYDILVKRNGENHYYECKSFASTTPPRRVPITKTQHAKAECAKDHYWLCVIYDINANRVKMLPPIANPAALGKIPASYLIDITNRSRDVD